MFWSFEMNQLLTKDRIGQMQREAERARLAKLAAPARVPPRTVAPTTLREQAPLPGRAIVGPSGPNRVIPCPPFRLSSPQTRRRSGRTISRGEGGVHDVRGRLRGAVAYGPGSLFGVFE